MSAQVGGFVDDKLYSRDSGDEANNAHLASEENDPYMLERRLNSQRAEASRAAQIKSAAASVTKKMAENEVKTMVATGLWAVISTVGSAIIAAIGSVLIIILPYILAGSLVLFIITIFPGLSKATAEFINEAKSIVSQ